MLRLVFAFALFVVPIAAASAEPHSANSDPYSPDRAQVSLEEGKARRFMDDFARCIASRQPKEAAALLALPYGSVKQHNAAVALASTKHDCLGPFSGALEFTFSGSSLASGMAEYFLTHPGKIADLRSRQPGSFVYAEPVGVEAFGECVVAQNVAAVETLAKSRVGSAAESSATDALTPQLAGCVSEGQSLELDRGSLRELLAVSLYKHIAMPPPVQPTPTAATQQQ
jgi:hypothetical protein